MCDLCLQLYLLHTKVLVITRNLAETVGELYRLEMYSCLGSSRRRSFGLKLSKHFQVVSEFLLDLLNRTLRNVCM